MFTLYWSKPMKTIVAVATSVLLCLSAGGASAQSTQPAPSSSSSSSQSSQGSQAAQQDTPVAIGVVELSIVAPAWSAKKDILGKHVYNDENQRIGKIEDILITPDNAVSFAIIGTGGFLGIGRHDVVIPIGQIQNQDGKFTLPGATKAALKALPAFKYSK